MKTNVRTCYTSKLPSHQYFNVINSIFIQTHHYNIAIFTYICSYNLDRLFKGDRQHSNQCVYMYKDEPVSIN